MLRSRRPLCALALCFAAAGLSACGKHPKEEPGRIIRAETEGIYLDVNELKYQVQVSRQLNPDEPGDAAYLVGIRPEDRELAPDETWFGVFLRVQNTTGEALPAASEIKIVDTQEREYEPLSLLPTNVFAYRSTDPIESKALIPEQDSAPSESPIQGSLLLFKVTNQSLDNRPLELEIEGRGVPQQTGIVDLDV